MNTEYKHIIPVTDEERELIMAYRKDKEKFIAELKKLFRDGTSGIVTCYDSQG